MPGFLFTNPWMLAGLTALAVPVVIHLLLKRRMRRLRFSTIQFFQKHDEQSSRRRKLRNWLLLSLRLLIVALLVLSFARPFLPQNQSALVGQQQRQVVFVLDRSASMLASDSDGERWAQARARMQKIIASLDGGDRTALVACGAHAEVVSGFAPPSAVAKTLAALQPGFGTSSMAQGLQQAVKLASTAGAGTPTTIYLVSDFQKNACRNLTSCSVPDDIEVKLVPVGDVRSPNTAITQLEAEPGRQSHPQVTIANFSEEDTSKATLDLKIDGQAAPSQSMTLKAGTSTNIDWALPNLKPGWHNLQATLKSKDSLEVDNARYGCLFIPEPVKVLLAQPRTTKRVFEQESFFLACALDPVSENTNALLSGLSVTMATPDELGRQVSGSGSGTASAFDLVVLPGLKDVPAGVGKPLADFVQAGGGLLLFVGEGVSPNRYHGEFRDLLPAHLGDIEVESEVGAGWRIAEYDTNALAFAVFRMPSSGDLHIPEFTKRFALAVNREASRLAWFDDGTPLLVTQNMGRGRVALVNASADTAWNDWPKHKTFVPWLHGLAKYLARKSVRDQGSAPVQVVAGEDTDLEAGPDARNAQLKLATPDKKEVMITADDRGLVRDVSGGAPGIYVLKDKSGQELRRFALNLPSSESDLEAMRPTDFLQQLVRVHENPQSSVMAGLFSPTNNQRDLWRALLLVLLVLLLIEPLVANRTSS